MLHRRTILLAVTLALGLLIVPAGPAAAPGSLIALDPSSGPPGTPIRVTPILRNFSPGPCTASWDGQQGAQFTCGADSNGFLLSTTLTAPQAPGVHTITVCRPACDSIDTPSFVDSAGFTVLAVVPDLGSLSLADARQQLEQASLTLGTVQGPSDDPAARVSGQVPLPGTSVDPGSAVNVTVTAPAPTTLVTVPALLGRTRTEANALVTGKGLILQVNSGTGRVEGQDPPPGSRVAPGSVVTVTLQASSAPVLVVVPDVGGLTFGDAEAAVASARLVLRATGPRTGTVQTQTPSPGTRVRQGSTVSVTLTASTSPSSAPTSPPSAPPTDPTAASGSMGGLALVAVVLVLVALATWMLRRTPRRRSPQWARQHVRVTSGASPAQPDDSQITEAGPGATHAVGLEPHPDRGSQMLEEAQQ